MSRSLRPGINPQAWLSQSLAGHEACGTSIQANGGAAAAAVAFIRAVIHYWPLLGEDVLNQALTACRRWFPYKLPCREAGGFVKEWEGGDMSTLGRVCLQHVSGVKLKHEESVDACLVSGRELMHAFVHIGSASPFWFLFVCRLENRGARSRLTAGRYVSPLLLPPSSPGSLPLCGPFLHIKITFLPAPRPQPPCLCTAPSDSRYRGTSRQNNTRG